MYYPPKFRKKIVSAEDLAIAWIETRTDLEMTAYSQLVEISSAIIREAFSTKVITPGVTTTDDVVWWMREKVIELGLDTWFHPTVDVQRNDESDLYAFDNNSKFDTILPGDLLHCDFGISYLTLNTDTQELGYVLKPEETSAPDFLVNALKDGNRVQDIFTNNFKQGATGNQILKKSLEQGKAEGSKAINLHSSSWAHMVIQPEQRLECGILKEVFLFQETIHFNTILLMQLS